MPRPSLRTRTIKRRNLRTPGSRSVVHYDRLLKPSDARCSSCGAILPGVPRLPPSKMANIGKSRKRPNRPYGGQLCSKCLSSKVRAQVFEQTKVPVKTGRKSK
ncbi:MAG: 50S ribosomal protein L34e [Promethearchaeati archaeon SRVP18_Atabeyarchaeia-1]